MSKLVTVKEYALITGQTMQAVYQKIKKGKIPTVTQKRMNNRNITLISIESADDARIKDGNPKLFNNPPLEKQNKSEIQGKTDNSIQFNQDIKLELVEILREQLHEKDKQIADLQAMNNTLQTQNIDLFNKLSDALIMAQKLQAGQMLLSDAGQDKEPAPAPAPGEGKGFKNWWYRFTHTTAPQVKSDAE